MTPKPQSKEAARGRCWLLGEYQSFLGVDRSIFPQLSKLIIRFQFSTLFLFYQVAPHHVPISRYASRETCCDSKSFIIQIIALNQKRYSFHDPFGRGSDLVIRPTVFRRHGTKNDYLSSDGIFFSRSQSTILISIDTDTTMPSWSQSPQREPPWPSLYAWRHTQLSADL